jgi:hypothetical protein
VYTKLGLTERTQLADYAQHRRALLEQLGPPDHTVEH